MTLEDLKNQWHDSPEHHTHIHELFVQMVNNDWGLNDHRTYCEKFVYGMGERSFHYLWKLILTELPESPKLLEIGCHKGQILSLWKMLREDAQVYGVTPLDGRGTGWTEDDYAAHIKKIHDDFGLEQPTLFIGGSEEQVMVNLAIKHKYDVCYVDGNHSFEGCLFDLITYGAMVKQGGYMVIDDSNCDLNMIFGYFQGIDTVTEAKLRWLETEGIEWEFICSVVHISVFRRK
jgi:Methyltransferase domain